MCNFYFLARSLQPVVLRRESNFFCNFSTERARENLRKERPLRGCASRHPSLRDSEGLRGPGPFATVVIMTMTIGIAGVAAQLVLCTRRARRATFCLRV